MLVAVVVALVTTAGSCSTEDTDYGGAAGTPRIGVLGDSVTFMGTDEIRAALDRSHQVRIRAFVGMRVDGTVGALRLRQADLLAADQTDVIVINLGTNQGHMQDDGSIAVTSMAPDYAALVASFRANDAARAERGLPPVCVVGVTVMDTATPELFDSDNDLARDLNAAIPTLVDEVADWAPVSAPYTNGNPHPSDEGLAVLAQLELDAVNRCGAGLPS
jgi:hypothetical protein